MRNSPNDPSTRGYRSSTVSVLTILATLVLSACQAPVQAPAADTSKQWDIQKQQQAQREREARARAEQARRAGPRTAPELLRALQVGNYHCDLKRRVQITNVTPDKRNATLVFNKRSYQMKAVQANTGALRLEDASSGLVWIAVVGKSMLLDTRKGRQLANECNLRG